MKRVKLIKMKCLPPKSDNLAPLIAKTGVFPTYSSNFSALEIETPSLKNLSVQ
jgi:hypothetical protein